MSDYGRISEELAKAKRYIAELEAKVAAFVERVVDGEPSPEPVKGIGNGDALGCAEVVADPVPADPMTAPEPAV